MTVFGTGNLFKRLCGSSLIDQLPFLLTFMLCQICGGWLSGRIIWNPAGARTWGGACQKNIVILEMIFAVMPTCKLSIHVNSGACEH